jgi:hypothetical protein
MTDPTRTPIAALSLAAANLTGIALGQPDPVGAKLMGMVHEIDNARFQFTLTLKTLADRWTEYADHTDADTVEWGSTVAELRASRARTYRQAATDLRSVLETGRLPHGLMTDAELDGAPVVPPVPPELAEVDRLRARVAVLDAAHDQLHAVRRRVRAIHREVDGSPDREGSCLEDGQDYPCATLRALYAEGEQQ